MAPAKHKAGPLSLRRFAHAICEKEAYARNFYRQRNGPRHAQNFVTFFVLRHATSVRTNASLNNVNNSYIINRHLHKFCSECYMTSQHVSYLNECCK